MLAGEYAKTRDVRRAQNSPYVVDASPYPTPTDTDKEEI